VEYLWTPWRMSYIKTLSGDAKECVFCAKLDADDEAEYVLRRGDTCYVGLNVFPYNSGHILVVPNEHVASIEGLAPELTLGMWLGLAFQSTSICTLFPAGPEILTICRSWAGPGSFPNSWRKVGSGYERRGIRSFLLGRVST